MWYQGTVVSQQNYNGQFFLIYGNNGCNVKLEMEGYAKGAIGYAKNISPCDRTLSEVEMLVMKNLCSDAHNRSRCTTISLGGYRYFVTMNVNKIISLCRNMFCKFHPILRDFSRISLQLKAEYCCNFSKMSETRYVKTKY